MTANKAPLIVTDINELGDKRLDPKENLAKLTEENNALAQKRKIRDQDKLSNRDQALGRPMHASDLINRIQKLNVFIHIMPGGIPNNVAVRYPADQYITGFPLSPLPEYSCVVVDDRGVAKFEVRGWREVLKSLVAIGALTVEAVNKEFGIALGNRAERYDKAVSEAVDNQKSKFLKGDVDVA